MHINRRQFLLGGAALASVSLFSLRFSQAHALLGGENSYVIAATGEHAQGAVALFHPHTRALRLVPVGFTPHSFLQHPRDKNVVWAIEKWGKHATAIDVVSGKVAQRLICPEGTMFYGHGLFIDANTLVIVRVNLHTGKGHLVGFDAITGKQMLDYQVTNGGLHDTQRLPDGSMLVASSGTQRKYTTPNTDAINVRIEHSSIIHVSAEGKILDRKEISDDAEMLGHFMQLSDGRLVVLGSLSVIATQAHPHGNIYLGHVHSHVLKKVEIPQALSSRLKGEMLSAALNHDETMALVTSPGSDVLLKLDMLTGDIIGTVENAAAAIAFDATNQQFIVSSKEGMFIIEEISQNVSKPKKIHSDSFTSAHDILIYV